MKKCIISLLVTVLLASLTASCTLEQYDHSTTSTSPVPESTLSVPSSTVQSDQSSIDSTSSNYEPFILSQAHYDAAEPWQRAYFDTASALVDDREDSFYRFEMFQGNFGTPFITLWAGEKIYLLYWKDEQAKSIEYPNSSAIKVNRNTGNPIVTETSDDVRGLGKGYITYEITGEGHEPIYDMFRLEHPNMHYYFYASDTVYSGYEVGFHGIIQQLLHDGPMLSMSLTIENLPQLKSTDGPRISAKIALQKISDILLDSYEPPVPQEAPEWVSTHMKLIHNSISLPYLPANSSDIDMSKLNHLEFISLETAATPADPPTLRIALQSGIRYVYVFHHNRMEYLNNYERKLRVDANGQLFVHEYVGSSFGRGAYYAIEPDGLKFLFSFGDIYCDGQKPPSQDSWTVAKIEEWFAVVMPQALETHGYTPPNSGTKLNQLPLPDTTSWDEMETALIESLCDYAKAVGQWDV